jgi:translation initiation factor 2B subunit (eIF-2B alpha/beta/delta family)
VKTSHNFNETEQLIREMMENIHKIRQNRENNSVTFTEQKRIIEQEIRELRGKINKYDCNLSLCSWQNSLISKTNDGNFWYSEIGMVLWFRAARENNSVTFTEQKRIIEQEIRELRGKINNHLDKLQEDLLSELTEAVTIVTGQTSELLVSNFWYSEIGMVLWFRAAFE